MIDGRTDSSMQNQRVIIEHFLGELISRPFVLSFFAYEVECLDTVAVKGVLVLPRNSVVTVYPDQPMIIRDRKGENIPVKLFLALGSFVKLHNTFHGNSHTMSVPAVCHIQRCGTEIYLARERRELYSVSSN